ncbi:hypothetical protein [Aestuariivivens marinum]|uniref:hypothetical protein n=1 Tax=Aestuariivivens marinum TaxID=2913555 RepID=UPI001F57019C|nr:hypothetical protein [Aestuariivivens marinum]
MKLLQILLILCGLNLGFAQDVIKFRALTNSAALIDEQGNWDEWTEEVECNDLIVFNIKDQRVIIYGEKKFIYDFIDFQADEYYDNFNVLYINCVNNSGDECMLQIRKKTDGNFRLLLRYKSFATYYDVKML